MHSVDVVWFAISPFKPFFSAFMGSHEINKPGSFLQDANQDPLVQDPFNQDPFDQMKQMQKLMHKQMTQGNSGIQIFQFGSGDSELTEREDNDYYYYELKGQGKNLKNIDVKSRDGMITINGEIETKNETWGSTMVSSFSRSFSPPAGVNPEKFEIEQNGQDVVIKFPKTSTL